MALSSLGIFDGGGGEEYDDALDFLLGKIGEFRFTDVVESVEENIRRCVLTRLAVVNNLDEDRERKLFFARYPRIGRLMREFGIVHD